MSKFKYTIEITSKLLIDLERVNVFFDGLLFYILGKKSTMFKGSFEELPIRGF